jgi:hypothetical protein
MNKLFTILSFSASLLLAGLPGFSQSPPSGEDKEDLGLLDERGDVFPADEEPRKMIIYEKAVPVAGLSQDELYSRGKEWLAGAVANPKEVLQLDTKDKIIGKGSLQDPEGGNSWFYYTISLTFKNGQYRYEFSDIPPSNNPPLPNQAKGISLLEMVSSRDTQTSRKYQIWQAGIDSEFKRLSASLQSAMARPVTAKASGR